MRREWELEDLIECWTLDEAEVKLLANKSGATRLGFALMLKFFELEGRFPRREDVPKAAVDYMAGQVKVDAALFAEYRWSGSTIEYHRAQIRRFHGFRETTVADEDKLTFWLADKICPVETSRERLRAALLARCREDRTEPPTPKQIERLAGAAEALFEREFTATTMRHRQAGASQGHRVTGQPVRGGVGEGGGGAAGTGDAHVPVRLRRRAGADQVDPAGGAVLGAQGGDDRRPGGVADPARAQDQRAGREEGRERAEQRVPAGAGQVRHLGQARPGGAGPARGARPQGDLPGGGHDHAGRHHRRGQGE
ncbi:DUF4158 domain-containing protein [Nonomuraea sp. NBC_01738]|uniref:DUF4158 domain-containing protein n=1 Tax=Nonomuraea sp. NBC_01738 TaxID=2976003 RepID=UPI002E0E378E|nr:DUF4158 domain-containing protein [Nonomuraea sp. NBC_01738]